MTKPRTYVEPERLARGSAGPLFGDPPAQSHSPTSVAAAEQAEPNAGTQRARLLQYLRGIAPHGMTDEQLQDDLAMNPSTQRPRRVELVRAGLVKDSGKTRATTSGRKAVVWVAV